MKASERWDELRNGVFVKFSMEITPYSRCSVVGL